MFPFVFPFVHPFELAFVHPLVFPFVYLFQVDQSPPAHQLVYRAVQDAWVPDMALLLHTPALDRLVGRVGPVGPFGPH